MAMHHAGPFLLQNYFNILPFLYVSVHFLLAIKHAIKKFICSF